MADRSPRKAETSVRFWLPAPFLCPCRSTAGLRVGIAVIEVQFLARAPFLAALVYWQGTRLVSGDMWVRFLQAAPFLDFISTIAVVSVSDS